MSLCHYVTMSRACRTERLKGVHSVPPLPPPKKKIQVLFTIAVPQMYQEQKS